MLLLLISAHLALSEELDVSSIRFSPNQTELEINRNVTDPVSLTWSLKLKDSLFFLDGNGHADRGRDTLTFQPTMPVLLTDRWKFIARPKFTLLDDKPFTENGQSARTTGFGDTILDAAFSPVLGPWLLGLGPTFVFPTASEDQTGQGKWQAGPGAIVGYRTKTWLAAVIEQQWWSFAGESTRGPVNEMNLQYIASYFLPGGWSIGTSPTIKIDWRAAPGNQVTFPIGLALGRVVKIGGRLPVKLEFEGQYMPVSPNSNGEKFGFQFTATPVVPSPVNNVLFDAQP